MKEIELPDKWLVIGCGALVGSRFVEITGGHSYIHGAGGDLDKNNPCLENFSFLDITDADVVEEVISSFPGKYVINFAGSTLVDEIEQTRPQDPNNQSQLEQNMAYRINVLGTRFLLRACKKFNKLPILISTGFVFDGKNGPYNEEDPVAQNPADVSWYAWTKILAEREALRSGINCLNIRVSYPYRSQYQEKSDFARNFLTLFDEVQVGKREWYPIFTDQTLTPTFIDDLPRAVLTLIENQASGTYHLTSPELCTPYQFCLELLKVARGVENPQDIVSKGSLANFQKQHPGSAKRPLNGGEKTGKITKLGFTPTNWRQGIRKAFAKVI